MTYNDTNTSPLALPQTLPDSQPRQFDWMVHIDLNLLVPFVLRVLPEVRKGWVEKSGANGIGIRNVIPLLFARVKELVKVGPSRHVSLHVENVRLVGGKSIKVGCCFEVRDEDACAESMGLLCHAKPDS